MNARRLILDINSFSEVPQPSADDAMNAQYDPKPQAMDVQHGIDGIKAALEECNLLEDTMVEVEDIVLHEGFALSVPRDSPSRGYRFPAGSELIGLKKRHNRAQILLRLPFLIWELVSLSLRTTDIFALALTCTGLFELLASTKLFEVLDWRNPAVTNSNLRLWIRVPPIFFPAEATRELVPNHFFWYQESFPEVVRTLLIRDDEKGPPGIDRDFPSMFRVMLYMRNLKHLTIQNTLFPILDFLKISESLASLRELSIIDVVFDLNVYGALPPVHRRLFRNSISLFIRGAYQLQLRHSEFGIIAIIRLLASPSIVCLDIDMHVLFAVYTFLEDRGDERFPWQVWLTWERRSILLPNLRHLTFNVLPELQIRTDVLIGPREREAARQLIGFVQNLYPDIRTLTVRGSMPLSREYQVPRESLLFLHRFTGPLHLANHYLGEKNHLHTLNVVSWVTDVTRLVTELKGCPPSHATRTLALPVIYPSPKVFSVLHKAFPRLQSLHLKFGFKLLSKTELVEVVPPLVAAFKRLETLHFTSDTLTPDIDEGDLVSVATAIGKECAGLTELRLYFDRLILRDTSNAWHF
ncbi:hypothetical protein V5O48_007247 [Marasmius crinis-equi]|uniref:F-box domain-containing protein n=1 Tax=Marasmius crinis-equi TaxID=585013 RepID=A0ABR3FHE6_9AGAR